MEPTRESEKQFYQTLQSKIKLVYLYENLSLLKYAADLVPTEDLNMKATLKLSVLEDSDDTIALEDILLLELLNWFKFSFFTWVDRPKCEACGQIPEKNGVVSPDESEIQWGASTVEQYFCTKCQLRIRFPRYNHPKKLLETRRGRCGEWANCFTLLCRALGYDARFVLSWTDHVWTEVFSFSKNRWLHCDPCENVCDKPLLYEIGWKAQISYVIAVSKDEVQDVTWRYTSNFSEVMKRRTLCREEWLINCLLNFTEKLQSGLSSERRGELSKRRVLELAEFLSEPKSDSENYGGRTSGSLAWRLARGETNLETNKNVYVFTPTEKEIVQKYFHIKYSCALDKYVRVSDGFSENKGWNSCTFNYNNIFRKVETDWKMVYLVRSEESDRGEISWNFCFKDSGLSIQKLEVSLRHETFENGKVKWLISSVSHPDVSKTFLDPVSLNTDYFKGSTGIVISAELTEGKGRQAWQHSQLFRQSVDSTDFPFQIKIFLE